jgi:predicted histidine transporter YuiF (NhaC family)
MYSFIVYIVISLAAYFIVEKIVRRWWGIPYNRKSGLEGLGTTHTWVMRIGWTAFFIYAVFFKAELVGAMIIFLLMGFDAFMQWRMNKAERENVIRILGLVFFIIFITVGYTFDFLV